MARDNVLRREEIRDRLHKMVDQVVDEANLATFEVQHAADYREVSIDEYLRYGLAVPAYAVRTDTGRRCLLIRYSVPPMP